MADAAAAGPPPGGTGTQTLLSTVRNNAAQMSAPGSAPAQQAGLAPTGGTQTAQLAGIMGTAQSGKAQGPAIGGQAAMSALSERLAGVNTLMAAQGVQQGAVMQSEAQMQQAAAQQQQAAGQLATLNQDRLNAQADYQNKVSGMLQQGADQFQSMVNADNKSRVEQLGTMLRLGNETYIQALNTKATEANLSNKAAMTDAIQSSVFASESNLLGSSLEFRNIMSQDARTSLKTLAGMDLSFAVQVATTENKSAASTMMWSGLGSAAGIGAGYPAGKVADAKAAGNKDDLTMQDATTQGDVAPAAGGVDPSAMSGG